MIDMMKLFLDYISSDQIYSSAHRKLALQAEDTGIFMGDPRHNFRGATITLVEGHGKK